MRMSTHEKKKAKKGILAFGLGNYQAFWHIGNSTYALDIFLVGSIMSRFIYLGQRDIFSLPFRIISRKGLCENGRIKNFSKRGVWKS